MDQPTLIRPASTAKPARSASWYEERSVIYSCALSARMRLTELRARVERLRVMPEETRVYDHLSAILEHAYDALAVLERRSLDFANKAPDNDGF